jgi:hypothetical protein
MIIKFIKDKDDLELIFLFIFMRVISHFNISKYLQKNNNKSRKINQYILLILY